MWFPLSSCTEKTVSILVIASLFFNERHPYKNELISSLCRVFKTILSKYNNANFKFSMQKDQDRWLLQGTYR